MLARPVKCPVCNESGDREGMVLDGKRYYHPGSCLNNYRKQQEETNKENEQWDKLYQYIIRLHQILFLPKANITRLKDLRAGFENKNGKRTRKYKSGPDFGLMLEAYLLAEETNQRSIVYKIGNWSDVNQVNYTISTMLGHLNDAWRARQNKSKQEVAEKRVEKLESNKDQGFKTVKPIVIKKDDLDISDFL